MAAVERALNVAVLAAFGAFMGWAVFAWLTDPTSDAGCDDPRMICTEAGTSPAAFLNHNDSTQESE